jgi:SAM-dependent methyltransferase
MATSKPSIPEPLSPQGIMELAFAFQRSRVLLTAHELDLFTVLGDGSKSSSEVAQALGTKERATDRLMNALCAMSLLTKQGGRFSNTPPASRFLVKGKPEFMAGLMHMTHLWETWSTLTEAVRQGRSVADRTAGVNERGADWLRAFIAAMHWRASQHAPGVVGLLDLSGVSRVLDVGGGSGAYAMAFVRAKPDIGAVVFDLPTVVPLTQEYIRQAELSDKVKTVVGDYDRDALGSGFDLVFLSAIIHSNSPSGNRDLIGKAATALAPHGQVVVQDFIVDEDRTGPPFAALFALNMLVGTGAGDTYTESEVRRWMEDAGLRRIARQDTPFGTSLIIGRDRGDGGTRELARRG